MKIAVRDNYQGNEADLSDASLTRRTNKNHLKAPVPSDNLQELQIIDQIENFESGGDHGVPIDSYEKIMAEQARSHLGQRCLTIKNLRKCYDNGTEAVRGINLKMFADQIFVLLGHNGAGKTSTIQMLTGSSEASEGSA